MDWKMPWYTISDTLDTDFGVHEWHGTNAFIRDQDDVFRTYFINSRGDEQMGSTWNYLDITALGRQEEWEDSPEGYPQTPLYTWWNWHDEYSNTRHTSGRKSSIAVLFSRVSRSGATRNEEGMVARLCRSPATLFV